jgi:hypothetical protein
LLGGEGAAADGAGVACQDAASQRPTCLRGQDQLLLLLLEAVASAPAAAAVAAPAAAGAAPAAAAEVLEAAGQLAILLLLLLLGLVPLLVPPHCCRSPAHQVHPPVSQTLCWLHWEAAQQQLLQSP